MSDPHKKKSNIPLMETRQNIIAAVPKLLSKKFITPDLKPNEAALLELKAKRDASVAKVRVFMDPIITTSLMLPGADPNYAHSDRGRANLVMQTQEFFTSELSTWSMDDLIYMLSLEYAFRVIESRL